jgi:hypothetical protein
MDSIEIFKSYPIDTIANKKLSAITLYTNVYSNEKNTLIITGFCLERVAPIWNRGTPHSRWGPPSVWDGTTGDFFGCISSYEITSKNKLN